MIQTSDFMFNFSSLINMIMISLKKKSLYYQPRKCAHQKGGWVRFETINTDRISFKLAPKNYPAVTRRHRQLCPVQPLILKVYFKINICLLSILNTYHTLEHTNSHKSRVKVLKRRGRRRKTWCGLFVTNSRKVLSLTHKTVGIKAFQEVVVLRKSRSKREGISFSEVIAEIVIVSVSVSRGASEQNLKRRLIQNALERGERQTGYFCRSSRP